MGRKIFVGGLAWKTTDDSLRAAFEKCGAVEEAKVILDRDTGKSRGFGFVTFADEAGCQAACEQMDGAQIDGRAVRVNEAEDRPRPGGGGGGGGGGGHRGGGGGHRGGGGGGRW